MTNRWGKMETMTNFIFLDSKISMDGHEFKRHLLLGRKTMTNLDRALKSRDRILLTKVHIGKAIFFLVVMYRYECWNVKDAEF